MFISVASVVSRHTHTTVVFFYCACAQIEVMSDHHVILLGIVKSPANPRVDPRVLTGDLLLSAAQWVGNLKFN